MYYEKDMFFTRVFFHEHSRFTGQHGKAESINLTPPYHFRPLHGHLDISRMIAARGSPLHIATSRTRNGNREKLTVNLKKARRPYHFQHSRKQNS